MATSGRISTLGRPSRWHRGLAPECNYLNLASGANVPQSVKDQAVDVARKAIAEASQSISMTPQVAALNMSQEYFSVSPNYSFPPLMITFTQVEHQYDIDFGDGVSISNSPQYAAHAYKKPGIYVVAWYRTHKGASVCVNDCSSGAPVHTASVVITGSEGEPMLSTTTPVLHQ